MLKPGTLRFSKWLPNFSPKNQWNTNANIWTFLGSWFRFLGAKNSLRSPSGIGVPVNIDVNNLGRKFGLFAHFLVDAN